jgi:Fe-S cluster biogenesis protein NfuA
MPQSALDATIRRVLGPLVRADGGELYLVHADATRVVLHLGGRFAGCPGNQLVTQEVIAPAIRAIAPDIQLDVSWGMLVPAGAERVGFD